MSSKSIAGDNIVSTARRMIQCTGDVPCPRAHATLTQLDGTNKAILYGGTDGNNYFDDMYMLDLDKMEWTQLASTNQPHPAKSNHTCSYLKDSNSLLVFGGFDGHKRGSDTWLFDLNKMEWHAIKTRGEEPKKGRSSHASTLVNNMLITTGRESGQRRWSDLHVLDLRTGTWSLKSSSLASRSGHSHTLLGSKLIIYGGRSSNEIEIVDTKTFTSTVRTFEKIKGAPKGRSYHSADMISNCLSASPETATSVPHPKLFVLGGVVNATEILNELHILDLEKMTWIHSETILGLPPTYAHNSLVLSNDNKFLHTSTTAAIYNNTDNQADSSTASTNDVSNILVFGGITTGGKYTNEMCIVTTRNKQRWRR